MNEISAEAAEGILAANAPGRAPLAGATQAPDWRLRPPQYRDVV